MQYYICKKYFAGMFVCILCPCLIPAKANGIICLKTGIIDGCVLSFMCWKSNPFSLHEQEVLKTILIYWDTNECKNNLWFSYYRTKNFLDRQSLKHYHCCMIKPILAQFISDSPCCILLYYSVKKYFGS